MKRGEPMKRTGFARKAPDQQPKPAPGARKKVCRVCKAKFAPASPLASVCGVPCAIEHGKRTTAAQKAKARRAERVADKKKLEDMQPLEYFMKKAERACNAYIRARDAGNGCISCGRHDAEQWNAGHFVSVGANRTLRFEEDNIHLQCARPCNKDKGGNIVEYRKTLVLKIGAARVEWLEGWHEPVKRTRADVEAIEAHYKAKLAELKKEKT